MLSIAAASSPNIVLIISDDQAWTDYSFMGHTDIKTPHIDKLAKEEANASAEFASASPFPEPDELLEDIYWETDNPEKRVSEGRIFFENP